MEDYHGRWFTIIAQGWTGPPLNSIPFGQTCPFSINNNAVYSLYCAGLLRNAHGCVLSISSPLSLLSPTLGWDGGGTPRSSSTLLVTMTLPMAILPTIHTKLYCTTVAFNEHCPLFSIGSKKSVESAGEQRGPNDQQADVEYKRHKTQKSRNNSQELNTSVSFTSTNITRSSNREFSSL